VKDGVKKPDHTKLAEDGLHYRSKSAGSAFGSLGDNTRSCFKCGKHRSRSQLRALRILGRTELVCAPSCEVLATEG
jgi:hypothetical protein